MVMRNGKPLIRLGNMRQAKYVQGVMEGKTKYQAALDAGYSESSARSPRTNIEKGKIRAFFQEVIREAVPLEDFKEKVREGVNATVVKIASFEGAITDERVYADFGTRLNYLRDVAEWAGYHVPKAEIDVSDSTADTETQIDELLSLAASRLDTGADPNGANPAQESTPGPVTW